MKRISQIVVILIAAGTGAGIGYLWRGTQSPKTPPLAVVSDAVAPTNTLRSMRHRDAVRSDNERLDTKLARDLAMSSGVSRWLYWFAAMEHAKQDDFPRLFRLAQGDPDAKRLVSDRWIQLHPRQVFDNVLAALKTGDIALGELSHQLFRTWSKRDPEAAIAAVNEIGGRMWRDTVAGEVIEKDPERGLRLFYEWGIGNIGPRVEGIEKWATTDPRHAAEVATKYPSGYASRLTMETIGKVWAKSDPVGALEYAARNPGEFSSTLAGAAVKQWAGKNLTATADWLAQADAQTRNRLSPTFVESWASKDPTAALGWCEANLSGSSLAQAVGGVVRGTAEKNVAGAAELVAAMSPSAARTEAAAAICRKLFPDMQRDDAIKPESVAWLSKLDPDSSRRVLDEVGWQWVGSDPKSMAQFLTTAGIESVPGSTYARVGEELAKRNPLEALEWANQLPESGSLAAGGAAFTQWRITQPEAAMNWFNQLPATDSRRVPYLRCMIRALAWDPRTAGQLTSMNVADRAIAQDVVENLNYLPEDRRAKLIEMLKPK